MDEAKQGLVTQYVGTAHAIAVQVWRTAPHSLELDELKSIAIMGLLEATNRWETYCLNNGYSPEALQYFKAYVTRRIRGAIYDHIRSQDWATRSLRAKSKLLQEAGQDDGATDRELADRTGMTVKEVRTVVSEMSRRPVYLAPEDDPIAVAPAEEEAQVAFILREMVRSFSSLSWDQQVVVALRYFEGMELREISATLRLPDARINELHSSAVLEVFGALLDYVSEEK